MGLGGAFRSIRLLFTRIGEFKPLLLLVQRPLPLSTVGFSLLLLLLPSFIPPALPFISDAAW